MELWQFFRQAETATVHPENIRFCPGCGQPFAEQRGEQGERQRCRRCGYVVYRNPAPGITVLIHRQGQVLIGRRGDQGRYGGKWCLPGGYVEFEEHFLETAHREVFEETGLEVQLQGIMNVVSNQLDERHHTLVVVLMGTVIGGKERPGDDVTALQWIDHEQHLKIDYAFAADRQIIASYFTGTLILLPVDSRAAVRAQS